MRTREEVMEIGTLSTGLDFATLRGFFPRLYRRDPLLSQLGWALMLFAFVFGAFLFTDPVYVGGVNAWIKPIKFNISFGTYAWTVGWWFGYLRGNRRMRRLMRWSFFATIAVEIASIASQSVRAVQGHGNFSTPLDSAIFATMTTMIFVNTILVLWTLVLFWRESHGLTPAYLWAIRLSIVIFLLGNAIGGQMLAHHAHTIGAADGPSGLPFVNWSTIAGDLRISHFLSIHAIQVLPLVAFFLERFRPRWSPARQRLAVFVAAGAFSVFVLATWAEAMLGIPLLRM
jgi:hypothetical protein